MPSRLDFFLNSLRIGIYRQRLYLIHDRFRERLFKTVLTKHGEHSDIVTSDAAEDFLDIAAALALLCFRIQYLTDNQHVKRRAVKMIIVNSNSPKISCFESGLRNDNTAVFRLAKHSNNLICYLKRSTWQYISETLGTLRSFFSCSLYSFAELSVRCASVFSVISVKLCHNPLPLSFWHIIAS